MKTLPSHLLLDSVWVPCRSNVKDRTGHKFPGGIPHLLYRGNPVQLPNRLWSVAAPLEMEMMADQVTDVHQTLVSPGKIPHCLFHTTIKDVFLYCP